MSLYLVLFAYSPEALARFAEDPQDHSAAVREMGEAMVAENKGSPAGASSEA